MRRPIAALAATALLALGALTGCGGGDDEAATTAATPPPPATAMPTVTTPLTTPTAVPDSREAAEARAAATRKAKAAKARAQREARAARARAAREKAKASALKFKPNWVRFKVITKEHLGGQMQAFVVGRGGDMDNMRQASDCVVHFTGGAQKANFCWVFPSQKALNFAKVDRDDGSMRKLCWTGRAGIPLSGSADADVDVNDSGLFEADGCPR